MRVVVDTCGGLGLVYWLREQGHDVRSIEEEQRTLDDRSILLLAVADNRVLITNDKDFGTLVFVDGMAHCGIVLLRLDNERWTAKVAAIARTIDQFGERIVGAFLVVTDTTIRVGRGQR